MKKMLEFFKKKYIWALILGIFMSISTTFTLLDALVIPKSYVILTQVQNENTKADTQVVDNKTKSGEKNLSSSQASTEQTEAAITNYSYTDVNISINIEKMEENGAVFYVADVQVSDISYLKTAFAKNTFGKNITQTTSEIAQANNAIFAINGDYYGFRDTGLIIRNGALYRDVARRSPDNQALTINSEGELEIVTEGEASGTTLIDDGILQSFSFGPVLVQDGQLTESSSTRVSQRTNPRTAIGQISPLHYIFIVVDGRSNESNGMTLTQLAQEFVERGATVAYNLDGGGSSAMWLNGKIINNPTDGRQDGERSVSDIIYIGN